VYPHGFVEELCVLLLLAQVADLTLMVDDRPGPAPQAVHLLTTSVYVGTAR